MRFNRHSELQGRHAFLSPSNSHWLNYDEQKLTSRYFSASSAKRGTDLHALASEAIRLGVPLHESNEALGQYVNDAIALRMTPEQPLFYSDNCFGTADALSFFDLLLRVHDLKTGITAVNFRQLQVYDALFCLEYAIDPHEIQHELRIYQRSEVVTFEPTPREIELVMEKIVIFDEHIEQLKEG